ncbi:DEAD-box helicase-related protein [Vibrio ishigakensis]|uniref:DEAD-box helicase-related protein n=1 Tax=Vibrio ishigakensis TaxID=1481914 RepID=A0A0B8Q513_9VIBR|nr:DEAD-box helicase-related protein [Vibrio ishigakensis]
MSEDQIKVIGGRRVIPSLDFTDKHEQSLEDLLAIAADDPSSSEEISELRFEALKGNRFAQTLRDVIVERRALTLVEINRLVAEKLNRPIINETTLLQWIDLLTGTKPDSNSEAFLKLRAHFFQRMTYGLWSCIDKTVLIKWVPSFQRVGHMGMYMQHTVKPVSVVRLF